MRSHDLNIPKTTTGHHFPDDRFLAKNKRSFSSLMWGIKILGGMQPNYWGDTSP